MAHFSLASDGASAFYSNSNSSSFGNLPPDFDRARTHSHIVLPSSATNHFAAEFDRARTQSYSVSAANKQRSPRTKPATCGFLWKRSDVVKKWRKRWFLLSGKFLLYIKSMEDDLSHPRGAIELDQCQVQMEGRDKPFSFSIRHPSRQTFYLAAESEKEAGDWIAAIEHSIRESSKLVFLEYRGHAVVDPDDAKEIAQADAEVKQFVYEQYANARTQLLKAVDTVSEVRRKEVAVNKQKEELTAKVAAIKAELASQQTLYEQTGRQLDEIQSLHRLSERARRSFVSSAMDLCTRLEHTDGQSLPALIETLPLAVPASSLDLTPSQLLQLSQTQLDYLAEDIRLLSQGEPFPLRDLLCQLLQANVTMRSRLNEYEQHILVLTQEKLDRFNREFESQMATQPPGKNKQGK